MDSTTIFGTLTALAGAVIAYLLKENTELKKRIDVSIANNTVLRKQLTKVLLAGQALILVNNDDQKAWEHQIHEWKKISDEILAENKKED